MPSRTSQVRLSPRPSNSKKVNDAQALFKMTKAAWDNLVQNRLARVSEGRVPQVVAQCNSLGKVLIEPQGPADGPGNLAHFQSVRETSAIVISFRGKEDLGFVLQAAERL